MQNLSGNFLNCQYFKNTFKESKHWRNIKNINFNNIFFKCFNFNNNHEIDSMHYNFFNITNNEDLIALREGFKQNTLGIYGFYLNYNNSHLICINSNAPNIENIIYHELSHFIQNICNIRLVKNTINNKNINNLHNILGTDLNQCLEYFSEKEFATSLNDLLIGLKNVKEKYYNKLNNINFILLIKNYLKEAFLTKNIYLEFFEQYIDSNNSNYYPLSFLITSYILQYKYQYIEQQIFKYFN